MLRTKEKRLTSPRFFARRFSRYSLVVPHWAPFVTHRFYFVFPCFHAELLRILRPIVSDALSSAYFLRRVLLWQFPNLFPILARCSISFQVLVACVNSQQLAVTVKMGSKLFLVYCRRQKSSGSHMIEMISFCWFALKLVSTSDVLANLTFRSCFFGHKFNLQFKRLKKYFEFSINWFVGDLFLISFGNRPTKCGIRNSIVLTLHVMFYHQKHRTLS